MLAGIQPEICRSLWRSRSTSTTTSTCAHDLPETLVRSITRITLRPRVTRASFCEAVSGETYISTSLITVPCSFCCAASVAAVRTIQSISVDCFSFNIVSVRQAVHGDFFLELVDQVCSARFPVTLRILIGNLLRQRCCLFARRVAFGRLVLNSIYVYERRLPPGRVVKRLPCLGRLRMLVRILFK